MNFLYYITQSYFIVCFYCLCNQFISNPSQPLLHNLIAASNSKLCHVTIKGSLLPFDQKLLEKISSSTFVQKLKHCKDCYGVSLFLRQANSFLLSRKTPFRPYKNNRKKISSLGKNNQKQSSPREGTPQKLLTVSFRTGSIQFFFTFYWICNPGTIFSTVLIFEMEIEMSQSRSTLNNFLKSEEGQVLLLSRVPRFEHIKYN